MYSCLYYWLIAPLRGGLEDTPEREPAFTLTINTIDKKSYEVALYCDVHGQPEFARLEIPELQDKAIPEAMLPLIQSIQEHLLSALRLTFKSDAMLAQPHTESFVKLGFRGTPTSTLHDLRDRCAHIKTGKDILGVTHLNLKEAARVESVLPYVRAICAAVINERAEGKFSLVTEVVHDGFRHVPTET